MVEQKVHTFSKRTETVYHGDIFDSLKLIKDNSVDLVFADPPYNLGKQFGEFKEAWASESTYLDWYRSWLYEIITKLKSNGSVYLMASTQAMPHVDLFIRKHLTVLSRIVWCYDSSGVQAKHYFGSLYEPILYAVKNKKKYTFNGDAILVEAKTGAKRKLIDYRKSPPKAYNTHKVPGNVWDFTRVRYKMAEYEKHPTQKPEALLERVIQASTNVGDLVLDPFSGTFTTSAVAKKLGRRSIGIEKEKEYVSIGLRRLGMSEST